MSWSREFIDPIETSGKTLASLRDAADYIQRLPKAEQSLPHWQDAIEHLIRAAEGSEGWVFFAWMFMLTALHHDEPPPPPRKRSAKTYKIIAAK